MNDKATENHPIQNTDYTPFNEEVIKRDYTSGNIRPDVEMPPLKTPVFTSPNLDSFDDKEIPDSGKSGTTKEPQSNFNPQFSELGKKEKEAGAEMMAELAIDGYSKIRMGIGSLVSMSKNKLDKEFAEGTIDSSLQIPIDNKGTTVSIQEFQEELNAETKNAFLLPEEFKEKVLPVLKRIFAKRGIGLTDEQLLMYYVGTDFASVLVLAVKFKRTLDGIYDNMRQQTSMMREQARNSNIPPMNTETKKEQPISRQDFNKDDDAMDFGETKNVDDSEFNQMEEEAITIDDDNDLIIDSAKGFKENPHPKGAPAFGEDKELLDSLQKMAEREDKKKTNKKK